ncbi:unnamed protein product [Ranitomeya imitator]|uniref:J domain-containing protein n=1 Tax=Ranitomeya imitator TaxID=111125 RepID=A0ABN9LSN0_9NEOB|nr:unnamed protein product [Ranitomeya imitator]
MMSWRGVCKEGRQLCLLQTHRCAGTYSRSNLKDHYQVLGVGRKATSEEIKNAFFTLSKKCHPDSDPANPLLHSQFVRLNEAYRVLSKHASRTQYDGVLDAIQRENWNLRGRSPYKPSGPTNNWKQSYQTDQGPYTRSTSQDHARYWSEFPPKEDWEESTEKRRKSNATIVLYCFLVGGLSVFLHYELFSYAAGSQLSISMMLAVIPRQSRGIEVAALSTLCQRKPLNRRKKRSVTTLYWQKAAQGTTRRAFRDIRNKELDEQQIKILKFYNERKENARSVKGAAIVAKFGMNLL